MPLYIAGIDPTAHPTTVVDWEKTAAYTNGYCLKPDPKMREVVKNTVKHGLPAEHAVAPEQGKFLQLLVTTAGARNVLEIGTLGGYSSIWLARGLPPDGKLVSLELKEKHAQVARHNIDIVGLTDKIEIIVGPAADSLQKMSPDTFDFVFIDADKRSNAVYFREAKRLVRKGGIILVDNMMLFGQLLDPVLNDNAQGVKVLLESLKDDPEVDCTTIGTASEKGYDGFLYAIRQ